MVKNEDLMSRIICFIFLVFKLIQMIFYFQSKIQLIMTRKFFFCFPLRVGNIVFGYTIIILSVAVIIYNMYMLGLCILSEDKNETEQKFRNWEMLEQLFVKENDSLVVTITLLYHMCYIFIGILLIIFTTLFLCGIGKANQCLVSTFFVYCFIHMFLTLCLIVWEATSKGYVQLGLILLSDVLLMLCLFGVKYLMESISSGYMYCDPGDMRY